MSKLANFHFSLSYLSIRPGLSFVAFMLCAGIGMFFPFAALADENAANFPGLEEVTEGEGEDSLIVEAVETLAVADRFDAALERINGDLATVLFFDVSLGVFQTTVIDPGTGEAAQSGPQMPFVVCFLALGAIFFTFYHRGVNLRGFGHACQIVRGRYSELDDEGDVTPFRALTSALSATVGLGNIAGVAVAMVIGGPGALFWMMVLGFFGMASKFHETTLAQLFRIKNEDGTVSGGPMFYLSKGIALTRPGLAPLGRAMAVLFAVCLMFAALGGGNMYQANQAFEAFFRTFVERQLDLSDVDAVRTYLSYGFGMLMAAVVGFVVLGGITRIGAATSRLVPFMAGLYVLSCVVILGLHLEMIPGMIALVFEKAFSMESAYGGLIGAMMIGFQRAAFSSEAGLGSSAVVHAAAKTKEPVREGFVASLEPFIDTIVVCFMTGMVVLVTGAYLDEVGGSAVTLAAFERTPLIGGVMSYILAVCIVLFAVSTMLAWCYYGERAWGYLFGIRSVIIFRLIFVGCVFVGAVASLRQVLGFADLALLSTCVPNIVGGILLAPLVKKKVQDYWTRYRAGEFEHGPDGKQL